MQQLIFQTSIVKKLELFRIFWKLLRPCVISSGNSCLTVPFPKMLHLLQLFYFELEDIIVIAGGSNCFSSVNYSIENGLCGLVECFVDCSLQMRVT